MYKRQVVVHEGWEIRQGSGDKADYRLKNPMYITMLANSKEEIWEQVMLRPVSYTHLIKNFEVTDESSNSNLRVYLKFDRNKKGIIKGIKKISKPGLRIYAKNSEIPRVLGGLGTVVVSTSKGLIAGDEAKKSGLGGEIICYIW